MRIERKVLIGIFDMAQRSIGRRRSLNGREKEKREKVQQEIRLISLVEDVDVPIEDHPPTSPGKDTRDKGQKMPTVPIELREIDRDKCPEAILQVQFFEVSLKVHEGKVEKITNGQRQSCAERQRIRKEEIIEKVIESSPSDDGQVGDDPFVENVVEKIDLPRTHLKRQSEGEGEVEGERERQTSLVRRGEPR